MTAAAAVALLLAVAVWARPQLGARDGRSPAKVSRRRRTATPPTVDEWATVLDVMSSEVRTGSSLAAAVQRAVERCQPHGRVLTPTATLASIDVSGPTPCADEAVVLQALRAAHTLGGPAAATLDGASAVLRERAVIRGEALAYSAQARLSASVLTGVPLVFAGWNAVSSRTFRAALFSPLGMGSAVIGAVCNLLGWWWMRRIVARAVV